MHRTPGLKPGHAYIVRRAGDHERLEVLLNQLLDEDFVIRDVFSSTDGGYTVVAWLSVRANP